MISRAKNVAYFAVIGLAILLLSSITALELSGCASTPTQQIAVTVLVDAAVGQTVQHGTNDPKVMAERAARIIVIAGQLKALDSGAVATVPLLTAALQPLLVQAKLGPADLLAANVLVAALSQVIQQKVSPTSPQTAAVQSVLQQVIDAASLYTPSTPAT